VEFVNKSDQRMSFTLRTRRAKRLRNPLDISLAEKELDWAPKIYLDEGIAKLAAWLREHKSQLKV
jgi:nucleoside-diphosphate-sugar epimerase